MKKRTLSILLALCLLIPAFSALSAPTAYADPASVETGELPIIPSSFDLRDVGGKCYTTPVRSQAPFGTCWSFATVAALESSILGAGLNGADGAPATPETLDLSEKQIAWFSATPLDDPGNPQNGEGQFIADFITEDALVEFMNRGGNQVFSANALAQGIGPVHESANPVFEYHGKNAVIDYEWFLGELRKYSYSTTDDWSIPSEYRFEKSYTVREARFLPDPSAQDENGYYVYNPAATEAIKEELMNRRAVQVNFCADTSMPGQEGGTMFISENWAHYTYLPAGTNHAVTIIGWDDNYSRDNFIGGTVEMTLTDGSTVEVDKAPPADGAWLVKNSWGAGGAGFPNEGSGNWGVLDEEGRHTGLFWLSYYDQTVSGPVSYVVEENDDGVNLIDQHDYMPIADAQTFFSDDEMKTANIFTADHCEELEEVSCFTSEPGMTVKYEIYLLDGYARGPEDGMKVAELEKTYRYGGYHLEPVADFDILFDVAGDGSGRILLTKYQPYSIVVTEKSAEGRYGVNFQYGYHEESGVQSFKGIVNEGESFYLREGEWFDYACEDDFREEMAEALDILGNGTSMESLTFDNFPIKGYCRQLEADFIPALNGNTFLYYKTDARGSSVIRIGFHATEDSVPTFAEDDVKWGLEEGGERVVTLTPGANGLRVVLTANNVDEEKAIVYVTVKGVGTIPFYAHVYKSVITGIFFKTDWSTGDQQVVFEYTGEPIEAAESVDCAVQNLVEGEDFRFVYENNVKCGAATVRAEKIGERVADSVEIIAAFVIVPQKPVIESVVGGEGNLKITLRDQSASGLSGYRIEYRAEGEEEWHEVHFEGPVTEAVVFGLDAGTYEVRASGYTEVPDGVPWFGDKINYGQTSDSVTATAKAAKAFSDVPENAYFAKPVAWAVSGGITAGTGAGTFSPYAVCTRAQAVTLIWRAAGSPEPTISDNPFGDVTETDYFYKAVLWAVEMGITTGTSADAFSPDSECTRAQIVTFLWRAAGCPGDEEPVDFIDDGWFADPDEYGEETETPVNPFGDVNESDYFYKAVLWAVGEEITTGMTETEFSPAAFCTRAQIVTFLYRASVK
ncbi:MAG: S-layer homology domain-containing protein [Clostridia bacterium]|nr:S-layer homology domain-containing protein [Clostridia bacterium]